MCLTTVMFWFFFYNNFRKINKSGRLWGFDFESCGFIFTTSKCYYRLWWGKPKKCALPLKQCTIIFSFLSHLLISHNSMRHSCERPVFSSPFMAKMKSGRDSQGINLKFAWRGNDWSLYQDYLRNHLQNYSVKSC